MIEIVIALLTLGITVSTSVVKVLGAIDQRADKTDLAIAGLQSEMGHQLSDVRKSIALQEFRLQQVERRTENRFFGGRTN